MYSRLIKNLLDGTGVKNLVKIREFEYFLNPLRDIHQLELDSYWAGEFPQVHQHTQTTCIDVNHLRKVEYYRAGTSFGKYSVPQNRILIPDDECACTSENGDVSQLLARDLEALVAAL